MPQPQQLRPAIARFLRRYVYSRRITAFLHSTGMAVTIANLWLLTWGVIDRFVKVPNIARMILLVVLVMIVVGLFWNTVSTLLRSKIDWRAAAEQVEIRDLRFNQSLVTVVRAGASPQLMGHLNDQVEQLLHHRSASRLVSARPVYVAWIMAMGSLILLEVLCQWPWLNEPQLLRRQVEPLAAIAPVTTTQLIVAPGSTNLIAGKSLIIVARDESSACDSMVLRVSTDGRNWSWIDMTSSLDGSFTHTISPLTRDIMYQIVAGDAVGGPYVVHVLPRASTSQPDMAAIKTIRSVQQQLAELPQTLADVERAAKWSGQIQDRARQAATQPESAAAAAERDQMNEAFDLVSETADPIDPELISQMARDLREHASQPTPADVIDQRLSPAVIALHRAIDAHDSAAVLRSTSDARDAIAMAQDALRKTTQIDAAKNSGDNKETLRVYFKELQQSQSEKQP